MRGKIGAIEGVFVADVSSGSTIVDICFNGGLGASGFVANALLSRVLTIRGSNNVNINIIPTVRPSGLSVLEAGFSRRIEWGS